MLRHRQRGVSLVELMIGISITAIALAAAMPSFTTWMADAGNRASAESVLNGLQAARMEALRRNAPVRFSLTNGEGKVAWSFGCAYATAQCPATIQTRSEQEGSTSARLGVSKTALPQAVQPGYFDTPIAAGAGLVADVVFDSLGRAPGAGSGQDITRIDVTSGAAAAKGRRYVVLIGAGGQVRMCDPALAIASNPQGCS